MINQRYSAMNDNFDLKLNNRSTPKKLQNYSEPNDKKVSVDVVYSELLNLKSDTTISFNRSHDNYERLETEVDQVKTDIISLDKKHETSKSIMSDFEKRLSGLEIMMTSYKDLRDNYEDLKVKVNDLSCEVIALKNMKSESMNSFENIIQTNITESFKEIKLSLDENMNVLNKMFSENISLNSNIMNKPGNQLMLAHKPSFESKTVNPVKEINTKIETTKTTPKTVSTLKPKGDSIEKEIEKPSVINNNSVQVTKSITELSNLQNKISEKPILDTKTDLNKKTIPVPSNEKPSMVFGQTMDKTPLFSKTSPIKEPTKTSSSIFTSLNTTVPPPSDKPLFGQFVTPTPKPTGILLGSSPITNSLFGNKSNQDKPPTNIFGPNTNPDKSQTNIFGNKAGSEYVQKNIFMSNTDKPPTNMFGASTNPEKPKTTSDKPITNLFGTSATKPSLFSPSVDKSDNKPIIPPSIFGSNSNAPSFSFTPSTDNVGFGSTQEVNWKAGSKLFSGSTPKPETNEETNEQSVEDEEHDPHFQPIIELPPLVQIATDEDSHDILFKGHCKLYRFTNKEWKERGVGEMKIMQTKKEIDSSRPVKLLMRRDQVRKICCNQRVTKDFPSFAAMPNPKSTCWIGNDFSEGEATQENFAIRFSNQDLLNQFKDTIAKIQESLSSEENQD